MQPNHSFPAFSTFAPARPRVEIPRAEVPRAEVPRVEALVASLSFDQTLNDARGGDKNAFSRLAERYLSAALRVAENILRTEEAAADAVQDALIKAHRAMHRFEDGNFRSWLLRIVANTCYDHLRRIKRQKTVSLDNLLDNTGLELGTGLEFGKFDPVANHNPERYVIEEETAQLIHGAINELPMWHKEVVILVDVQGYNYAETAKALKLPLGTVKSRLSRARITLRNLLVDRQVVVPG